MESHNPLPEGTRIGYVHLRVHSLEHVLKFYEELLGFKAVFRTETEVALSPTGRPPFLFLLTESKTAVKRPRRSPGLFHVAIRFPERKELAKTLARLIREEYPLQGASDHIVSEAIYLADPEGNGLELYADRPKETWQWQDGEIVMATDRLDVNDLLASAKGEEWSRLDPATDVGHVHLSVSSLEKAEAFYMRQLGFDLTNGSYPGALFMSAGGYHHHIGANIWMSRDGVPGPNGAAGLISVGIALPHKKWLKLPTVLSGRSVPFQESTHLSGQPILKLHDLDGLGVEFFPELE